MLRFSFKGSKGSIGELAVTVLASWAEQLGTQKPSGKGSGGKGESTAPATHDTCRLAAMIARLVEECLYPPLENYGFFFCLYKTEEDIKNTILIKVLIREYRCKFDVERPQSYGYHQQVGRVLSDLCSFNAAGFGEVLPPAEILGGPHEPLKKGLMARIP